MTGSLRRVGEVSTETVEKSLVTELAGNVSSARLAELEAGLRPMYAALPKQANGYLGHQAVRYALHRLLLQRHGWFIVGLEPSEAALPPYLHGDWVPQYLQGLLEERLGSRGINLREVVALAAAIEDLVHAEVASRVDQVYAHLHHPPSAKISGPEAARLLEVYTMFCLMDGNFSMPSFGLEEFRKRFKTEYADLWAMAKSWMEEIVGPHLRTVTAGCGLERAAIVGMADELGERFSDFFDGQCRSLKAEFLGMERPQPGRVTLGDFYRKGLTSNWLLVEKPDYLRSLGALDESNSAQPSVIIPNYLGSRSNCLQASTLYSLCCRNECEDLMTYLERSAAGPAVSPERIRQLVAGLPAEVHPAPPALSGSLAGRLREIAERHGGQVPLHGRLFAQWMHHAFPRECPYPHDGAAPQTPDEWMREGGEGEEGTRASEEEMQRFLAGPAPGEPCAAANGTNASDEVRELPWSPTERLLTEWHMASPGAASPAAWGLQAMHAVFGLAITGLLLGMQLCWRANRGCDATLFATSDLSKQAPADGQRPW